MKQENNLAANNIKNRGKEKEAEFINKEAAQKNDKKGNISKKIKPHRLNSTKTQLLCKKKKMLRKINVWKKIEKIQEKQRYKYKTNAKLSAKMKKLRRK